MSIWLYMNICAYVWKFIMQVCSYMYMKLYKCLCLKVCQLTIWYVNLYGRNRRMQ